MSITLPLIKQCHNYTKHIPDAGSWACWQNQREALGHWASKAASGCQNLQQGLVPSLLTAPFFPCWSNGRNQYHEEKPNPRRSCSILLYGTLSSHMWMESDCHHVHKGLRKAIDVTSLASTLLTLIPSNHQESDKIIMSWYARKKPEELKTVDGRCGNNSKGYAGVAQSIKIGSV